MHIYRLHRRLAMKKDTVLRVLLLFLLVALTAWTWKMGWQCANVKRLSANVGESRLSANVDKLLAEVEGLRAYVQDLRTSVDLRTIKILESLVNIARVNEVNAEIVSQTCVMPYLSPEKARAALGYIEIAREKLAVLEREIRNAAMEVSVANSIRTMNEEIEEYCTKRAKSDEDRAFCDVWRKKMAEQ